MERYREEIDDNTSTTFNSKIRIFGQEVNFSANKISDHEYELKAVFCGLAFIGRKGFTYQDKVFYQNSFSS